MNDYQIKRISNNASNSYISYIFFCGLILLFIIYFIFHLLNGKNNLFTFLLYSDQLAVTNNEENALKEQIDQLQRNIDKINSVSNDPDFIDEQLRRTLPYIGENEVMIIIPDEFESQIEDENNNVGDNKSP